LITHGGELKEKEEKKRGKESEREVKRATGRKRVEGRTDV